ncbi:hypothetical protein [Aeromonas veronii]|uniref:hypothetical protein n=1 Tax=Aeromonas veronii TaxID=654 RepID=UPI001F0B4E23|nr:hypothetical protein [Aeromonas veronii]
MKPAFRESIGRVVDGGRLRVQTIDAEPEGPAFDLLLENTSEDRWKLTAAVGAELARHLAEEHDRYARQPFFMAFEHEQFGRLYFEPVSPAQQQEDRIQPEHPASRSEDGAVADHRFAGRPRSLPDREPTERRRPLDAQSAGIGSRRASRQGRRPRRGQRPARVRGGRDLGL